MDSLFDQEQQDKIIRGMWDQQQAFYRTLHRLLIFIHLGLMIGVVISFLKFKVFSKPHMILLLLGMELSLLDLIRPFFFRRWALAGILILIILAIIGETYASIISVIGIVVTFLELYMRRSVQYDYEDIMSLSRFKTSYKGV
jgi:hypothetical protein